MKNKGIKYLLGLKEKERDRCGHRHGGNRFDRLIAIAALAVDVGYLLASRNELQNAADASALAPPGGWEQTTNPCLIMLSRIMFMSKPRKSQSTS